MEFDWNENKAKINLAKHKVSFEEAQTVFDDPLYLIFADINHSIDEKRFIIMGESNKSRCFIYRPQNKNPFDKREKGNATGAYNL